MAARRSHNPNRRFTQAPSVEVEVWLRGRRQRKCSSGGVEARALIEGQLKKYIPFQILLLFYEGYGKKSEKGKAGGFVFINRLLNLPSCRLQINDILFNYFI